MGRQPCCDKIGLKRGPWTLEEDQKLINFILINGIQCWRLVPKLAGLKRCGKSCRLRWINYLRPDLKRGAISEEEEEEIIQLHSRLGNRWSKIATHFPGRTDNEIKNHWNCKIKKKLRLLGLDSQQTNDPIKHNEEGTDLNSTKSSGEKKCSPQAVHNSPYSSSKKNIHVLQREGVDDMWGSSENDNIPSCENLDAASSSMVLQAADSYMNSSTNCEGIMFHEYSYYSFPEKDFQNWMKSAESLLSWESFNNLEDVFSVGDN